MAVRPGGAQDPVERIERILLAQERGFRAVFTEAIALLTSTLTLDEIATLLEQGRFEEALDTVDAAARLLGSQQGLALAAAAQDTARFLSGALTVSVAFDGSNARTVGILQRERFRLIQAFSADQRATLREALSIGTSQGLNPIDQARLFRDSLGLAPSQVRSVERYRALLTGRLNGGPLREALNRSLRDKRSDKLLERIIRDGGQLTPAQVDSLVERYRTRYIRYRSEVIARTEALRATHQGVEEMYAQAIENGDLNANELRRTWNTAKDERVRSSHSAIDGVTNGLGEPWTVAGGQLRFPGDPSAPASETVQCRCIISTRLIPEEEINEEF